MNVINYLIIGGGITGTTAAETIRFRDKDASITIITEETDQLYSRVLLPNFLKNEKTSDSVFLRHLPDYEKNKITLVTEERVVKIDTINKSVATNKKQTYFYEKLLLASGGKVNKLNTPGSGLKEVVYLRTLDDAKEIKKLIDRSKNGVVLGGGFIGMEFVQSFIKNGLKTTVVLKEKSFWETIVGVNSGKLISQILTDNGVFVITEDEISEFIGREKLENVRLKSGKTIDTDIAGIGIGIHLDIEYLKDTPISLNKGVITNEYLETSVPGIWAAGDLAEFYDPIFGKYHTLGNWSNASSQGRTVGINMSGSRNIFDTISAYTISIFGNNFTFIGDPEVDDETEVIERGSIKNGTIGNLLIKDDVVTGASLINLTVERGPITELIKNKTKITANKENLGDLNFDLSKS